MGFTHKSNINIGDRFGNLVVIEELKERKNKCIVYKCRCDCGNYVNVKSNQLIKHHKDNCGCTTKQSNAKRKKNKYEFFDNYVVGYTAKGNKFYFDIEDFDLVSYYCWIEKDGYLIANNLNGDSVRLHRLIMGLEKYDNKKVDHMNHDTMDNRKENLRITTNQENCFNHKPHSNNTSGYSGVGFRKELNKWRARIYVDGRCICLGNYDNINDAIKARLEAEKKYYGEYQYEFNK